MDALELIVESKLAGHGFLGELHPRGVRREGVQGTVAGGEGPTGACQQQRHLQQHHAIASWWK